MGMQVEFSEEVMDIQYEYPQPFKEKNTGDLIIFTSSNSGFVVRSNTVHYTDGDFVTHLESCTNTDVWEPWYGEIRLYWERP